MGSRSVGTSVAVQATPDFMAADLAWSAEFCAHLPFSGPGLILYVLGLLPRAIFMAESGNPSMAT